jgi:hypothetical protein
VRERDALVLRTNGSGERADPDRLHLVIGVVVLLATVVWMLLIAFRRSCHNGKGRDRG